MKKICYLITGLILINTLMITSCRDDEATTEYEEIVATANRVSGSVSFIDATNNSILKTLDIAGSEPMYAVYVAATDKLYVGDRSQNQVHVQPTVARI